MTRPEAIFQERHAVVTGASRGIGRAIAAALAARGARVSLLGRDVSSLRSLSAELGGDAHASPVVADVADSAAVGAAFAEVRRQFGPVQILVNSAGQAASAKLAATDEALWSRMLAVNVTGSFLCVRQVVGDMLKGGYGRIINVASVAGLKGAPYISAYAASKHAVIGLTRALAMELASSNITVNAVCPGFTETDIVRDAIGNIMRRTGRTEAEALQALVAANPQRRLITAEEIAHTVIWLCAPGAESITGQSIVVAGGEV